MTHTLERLLTSLHRVWAKVDNIIVSYDDINCEGFPFSGR